MRSALEVLRPPAIADAAQRLRAATVDRLDQLDDAALAREALPARDPTQPDSAWSVADVFAHLAAADRDALTLAGARNFLPGRSPVAFEDTQDRTVITARAWPRDRLRHELVVWGRRMAWLIRNTPQGLGAVRVPTFFGRVPLAWLAATRLYDEWVHHGDIAKAVGDGPVAMDAGLRRLLAAYQLAALPALPLTKVAPCDAVVEVVLLDSGVPAWRFDLAARRYGPRVTSSPSATVTTDTATFNLVAADRTTWRDAETTGLMHVEGDRDAASVLLDAVRVV